MVKHSTLITLTVIVGAIVLAALVVVTITTNHGDEQAESTRTVEECTSLLQQQYPDEELADLWSACEETSK